MLVITRKLKQSLYINGQEVRIIVLSTQGSRVKLGIEAPQHITIHRGEKYQNFFAHIFSDSNGEIDENVEVNLESLKPLSTQQVATKNNTATNEENILSETASIMDRTT